MSLFNNTNYKLLRVFTIKNIGRSFIRLNTFILCALSKNKGDVTERKYFVPLKILNIIFQNCQYFIVSDKLNITL